jgi:hypothetical protein
MTGEVGEVYVLHYDKPIGNSGNRHGTAQHYSGWRRTGSARLGHHANGTSRASLPDAFHRAGIGFRVGYLEPGTRDDERRLKNRHNLPGVCAICKTEGR